MEKAAFYHMESVQHLLESIRNVGSEQDTPKGEVLAAICLLRSYEIIARTSLSPSDYSILTRAQIEKLDSQCHLQGCYSLLACHPVTSSSGLARAAFWNYLREDITMALIERRRLMIKLSDDHFPRQLDHDCDHANYVTVLLGQVINHCFEGADPLKTSEWESLRDHLDSWYLRLPESFEPIVGHGEDPAASQTMKALQGWHGEYKSAVKICLALTPASRGSTVLRNRSDHT